MGDLSKNFSRSEFACHDGCGFDLPVPELVARLQALRSLVGRPIYINSGCRCKKHNAAVGGVPDSQHLFGRAADVVLTQGGMDSIELAYLLSMAKRPDLFAHGGIGVYERAGFLHLDVRGYPARWSG